MSIYLRRIFSWRSETHLDMRTHIQHREHELPPFPTPYGYPSLDRASPAIACDHSTHSEEQSNHSSLTKPEPLLPMLFAISDSQLTTLVSIQIYQLCALFITRSKCASISCHYALVNRKCTTKTGHFKTSDNSSLFNIKIKNKDRCFLRNGPGSYSLERR